MNDITYFNYNGNDIRTVEINNEFWWALTDVCNVLELSNPSAVAERLDEDERSKFDLDRQGNTWFVSESGLYSVILRSDKPQAKPFRRWVTHEVLPSIRKFGGYRIAQKAMPRAKSWCGEPVMTIDDIAAYLNIPRCTADDNVRKNLRDGLDYFILKGNSLKFFKFENPCMRNSTASAIILVRAEAFKNYQLTAK